MALQTFTAGQVLTAAQVTALQTNDFNQTVSTKTANYVLVAADKGTRVEMNAAGATTITVDTSLFNAGDTLFIQNIGAGVCTVTAGTATVSTSGSLALIQNAGGTLYFVSAGVAIFYASGVATASSGLTLISTTTFSAVASASLPLNTFTTTYDNYYLSIKFTPSTAITAQIRFRTSGTDNTSATYKFILKNFSTAGADETFYSRTATITDLVRDTGTSQFSYEGIIRNPKLSVITMMNLSGTTNVGNQFLNSTCFDNTTAFDSLSLIASTGNITGSITVYGFQK